MSIEERLASGIARAVDQAALGQGDPLWLPPSGDDYVDVDAPWSSLERVQRSQ